MKKLIAISLILIQFGRFGFCANNSMSALYTFTSLDKPTDMMNLNRMFGDLYNRKQESNWRVVTSTPTATEMKNNEQLYYINTTNSNYKLMFKDSSGNRYYVDLTKM